MNQQLTPPDSTNFERARNFISEELSRVGSYHEHKENMSHAAFLLLVALFSGIMTIDNWPPSWVPDSGLCITARQLTFIAICVFWFTIHVFIRWQLRNRRWAALQYGGFYRTLREWASKPPTTQGLAPFVISGKPKAPSKLKVLIDFLVPIESATLHSDVGAEGFPSDVARHLKEQQEAGTGAINAEWLLAVGSFLMLAAIWFRTFYGVVKTANGG